MCNYKKKFFYLSSLVTLYLFLFSPINSYSQKQSTIDSLYKLSDRTNDSLRVAVLRKLSWEYRNLDTSKAISIGNEALESAIKLNLDHEQADILGRLGVYKRNQGNFSKAMDYFFKGLDIAQKNKYFDLEALELNNIGDIYNRLGVYDQASDYVNKALKISIKLNDKYSLSYIQHMLGLIYMNKSMNDSALYYFKKSLENRKLIKFKTGIASSFLNIGIIYHRKANYDSSFIYYDNALKIFTQMNDKVGVANIHKCLGEYYNQKKEYQTAVLYFKKSIHMMKGYGNPQVNKEAAEGLKYSYYQLGDFKKALYYEEYATRVKDSISNNIFIQKITRLSENYNFEIKTKEQEILRKQKEEILNERIRFQKNQLNFFIIGFLLMVILTGITIYFYRDKNKAYKALNLKNIEIAELNNGLITANTEIKSQKQEIESQRDVLQEQSDKLKQLVSTKDKLFSIIAHDLRGPFNTIIGFSTLLKENMYVSKREELEEMINHINQVGINTLKILENLLNWAKTQINQVNINLVNVDISEIIKDVIDTSNPLAKSKNLLIRYQEPINLTVRVDENMVNTILRNLVSNSIKFSNSGGIITISAKQITNFIEVSVQDQGVGMSNEIKNSLFSSNVNTSSFGTANEKGTGLGLVICNEFIKKLNGKIWVESEISKGSIFSFTIPLKP